MFDIELSIKGAFSCPIIKPKNRASTVPYRNLAQWIWNASKLEKLPPSTRAKA